VLIVKRGDRATTDFELMRQPDPPYYNGYSAPAIHDKARSGAARSALVRRGWRTGGAICLRGPAAFDPRVSDRVGPAGRVRADRARDCAPVVGDLVRGVWDDLCPERGLPTGCRTR